MDGYDISKAFKAIENELIRSMMRNMERHKAEEDEHGLKWSAWQVEQLDALERYRRANQEKFKDEFADIGRSVEALIRQARGDGGMEEELGVLEAIRKGYDPDNANSQKNLKLSADFFRSNDRKMDALIRATTDDMKRAGTAMLRMANDQYRKLIFNAQVYANSGAGTYRQAVDMAARDFLRSGINCIEYRNGARHTAADYSEMAIRTANTWAALLGAGEKRNLLGVHTVIVNRRAAPCEKCLPFVGEVFIDDIWSGGARGDGSHPLLSTAVSAGLFHPNCKDGTSTYYPGITELPPKYTQQEFDLIKLDSEVEAKHQHAERQAEK